jgi:ABC-type lipoprotein release transport system permease subunit
MASPEQTPPPAGEEIHLPGPSLLPILNAAGITLGIIGITLGWYLSAVGIILFVVTTAKWIASTRRDIAELPPEHSSH